MTGDQRVDIERLQLVLGGIGQSLPIGLLLSTLLLGVFWFSINNPEAPLWRHYHLALLLWYPAFMALRVTVVVFSRYWLQRGFSAERVMALLHWLLLFKGLEGVMWGALSWIVLRDGVSPAAFALLLALMAAISSNAVAMLSPFMTLYLTFIAPNLVLTTSGFLWLDGLAYKAMGICCLIYVLGQYWQARLVGRGLNDSITLRFANLDLVARLETEKATASAAREQAEQANRAKSRFLAAASHDLRQPIHALGLFLETLSFSALNVTQHHVLDSARSAHQGSAEMLNTLLDFSRIEAGVIKPRRRFCALQPLLYKLESELAPQADARGLVYRTRETRLAVISDPALLELILRNLIANAIRYTESGGLLVACRRRTGCVSIEVIDTGIGIAPDQHQDIFREFHQLGNPERDRSKGLGLGLAIARGLAHSLGHTLTLRSRPGRGSLFRLMVACATEGPAPDIDGESAGSLEQSLVGRRLLVLDDDSAVRLGMHLLLSGWGCNTREAGSLDEALALDWPTPPEAIICDYRLREEQNGVSVIRHLREHFHADVPALLITGDTAPERLREAASSELPLLHKPVSAAALQQTLKTMLPERTPSLSPSAESDAP
ncbi:ATP-binding response regulator [Kushneria aurantia]|uniref:histidine kinase n=1 Tax=Kushneria aurantia TaxID=504092 RepID=A0ABV6FYU9_9GAMM|nr:hybrid sensor histidine kinase/response regulator [Kushneria aurantia]